MSSRITVNLVDNSGFTKGSTLVKGATVLRASKGLEEPVLFQKASESEIIQKLGYPSPDYPDVWEAIEFNKEYALWVSAPAGTGALHSGIIYTTTGDKVLTHGVADPSTFAFNNVPVKEKVGDGNGVLTNFTATLTDAYKNNSLSKVVIVAADGSETEIALTVTDAEPEVISGSGIDSGTMTRATDALDITFDTAPAADSEVYVVYATDLSATAYFALFEKSTHAQTTKALVTYSTTTGYFTINYYITDNRAKDNLIASHVVSQIPGTIDAQKQNIYIDDYFEDDGYLIGVSNDLAYTTFTDDTTAVALAGGSRGASIDTTALTAGWVYFRDNARKYDAQIYMDFTADDAIPALFSGYRNSQLKYKDFILPLPDNETVSEAISTKEGYAINNRGLAFYWNWRKVKDPYNSKIFWTSQIGNVGVMWARMISVYNGLAPAMVNEGELGGQLGGQILDMRYDPSDDEIVMLDNAGINGIVFDPDYGAMITSQRTAQSPAVLSDTSYIAHSRVFDYIISNVLKQVLVAQLIKLNDNFHQTVVSRKTEGIIDPVLASGVIREYAVKCDDENNTDEVKARREFKLAVAVKVTPTSETITFDFIASPQTVNVEDNFS